VSEGLRGEGVGGTPPTLFRKNQGHPPPSNAKTGQSGFSKIIRNIPIFDGSSTRNGGKRSCKTETISGPEGGGGAPHPPPLLFGMAGGPTPNGA